MLLWRPISKGQGYRQSWGAIRRRCFQPRWTRGTATTACDGSASARSLPIRMGLAQSLSHTSYEVTFRRAALNTQRRRRSDRRGKFAILQISRGATLNTKRWRVSRRRRRRLHSLLRRRFRRTRIHLAPTHPRALRVPRVRYFRATFLERRSGSCHHSLAWATGMCGPRRRERRHRCGSTQQGHKRAKQPLLSFSEGSQLRIFSTSSNPSSTSEPRALPLQNRTKCST